MRLMNEKNCIFEFYGLYIKRKYIPIIEGKYFPHILIIGGVFYLNMPKKRGCLKQSAFFFKNAPFLKRGRFLGKRLHFKKGAFSYHKASPFLNGGALF